MTDLLLDPWAEAIDEFPLTGTPEEQLRAVVKHAVLAPSGHNSQPWLFRVRDNHLDLLADRSRALPVVDPEDRELILSCGCALFYLRTALRHFGCDPRVTLLPDAEDPDLLARLTPGPQRTPTDLDHALFSGITRRRTNRFPFEDRPVPEAVLARARKAAEAEGGWLQTLFDESDRFALGDLIAEADRQQMADRMFRRELAAWVHSNRSGSRDGMPGYARGAGNLASEIGPIVIRTFDVGKGVAAHDRDLALGSPVLAVLWTEEENTLAWIRGGQALARLLLQLCADGVSVSYLNQPIEVADLRARLRGLLGREGYPQIILRLGFGREVRPTPRRPASAVIID